MRRWLCCAWWLLCWCWPPLAAATATASPDCLPQVLATLAVPVSATTGAQASTPPTAGWEPVTLPDTWTQRWPGHDGTVWYRLDWVRGDCPASAALGLGVDGISMAAEIYSNHDLLWRDPSLVEPLSLGWNTPRWWLLPSATLQADAQAVNTLWIRVVGLSAFTPGLGRVQLGPAEQVRQTHARNLWSQRHVYYITLGMSAAMGVIFLVVWSMMRSERAFGWYALMALCWVLYLATILATDPWPLGSVLMHSRLNNTAFVLYVLSFCLFTWRFGNQHLPRVERALWLLTGTGIALTLLAPRPVAELVWLVFALIFMANCAQFQWHAWRTRQRQHVLLALCWLGLLVVGMHDLLMVLRGWHMDAAWGSLTGPMGVVFMALLLGGQLASSMRRIARFNQELQEHVAQAQHELAEVLAREHAQALAHATLQQRMQIVHDLHDSLGGSLVRSMALVEQARAPLSNERMLSLLKVLRDDLRQVIDHGASDQASAPATPVQWIAPLRHRFTHLFDELEVDVRWQIPPTWQHPPSPLQCLGLARLLEEALSNVIKHSRARRVQVSCQQPQADLLTLTIADDGVGFDLEAVRATGLGVGMRSMAARAERMGAQLNITAAPESTQPQGTVIQVVLPLQKATPESQA